MQPKIIKKSNVLITPDLLEDLQTVTQEEGQVIVHCITKASPFCDWRARIQKTTFLFDLNSEHQSDLLHVENISIAPEWSIIEKGGSRRYSLIFSGLPKSCSRFELVELNERYNAFHVADIERNETDVYFLQL